MTLTTFALVTTSANADQRPARCSGNNVDISITRDHAAVRSGQSVTYTVTASNLGADACDITDATVTFAAPGTDGAPVSAPTTVAAGLDLPAGTPVRTIATVTRPVT